MIWCQSSFRKIDHIMWCDPLPAWLPFHSQAASSSSGYPRMWVSYTIQCFASRAASFFQICHSIFFFWHCATQHATLQIEKKVFENSWIITDWPYFLIRQVMISILIYRLTVRPSTEWPTARPKRIGWLDRDTWSSWHPQDQTLGHDLVTRYASRTEKTKKTCRSCYVKLEFWWIKHHLKPNT